MCSSKNVGRAGLVGLLDLDGVPDIGKVELEGRDGAESFLRPGEVAPDESAPGFPEGLVLSLAREQGVKLQRCTDLRRGDWVDVPLNDGVSEHVITNQGTMGFFRLLKP